MYIREAITVHMVDLPLPAQPNVMNALDNGATAADLKGSTFYVTLEPCHHTGRTPPCDRKLLEVGAARVVIAFVDPDDRVNGQGIKLLRESGVEVVVGVCEAEAKQSLLPFVHQRSSGKPYVVIKAAMSLDGRIACEDGTSQWITGENARQDGHRLRAGSQAIIVGSNTALKDRPRLNVRGVAGAETVTPLRVALDSTGKIVDGPLLDVSLGSTLIFTSERVKADVAQLWRDRGVEVVRVGEKVVGQGLDLDAVLTALAQRGILQVLIEGGGKLQSRFLAEDRADK
ncbi:5-amino-6-(5-phosphoribosylamino)uracil reductase, partial [Acanthamoeba castellanii str. Neff]